MGRVERERVFAGFLALEHTHGALVARETPRHGGPANSAYRDLEEEIRLGVGRGWRAGEASRRSVTCPSKSSCEPARSPGRDRQAR